MQFFKLLVVVSLAIIPSVLSFPMSSVAGKRTVSQIESDLNTLSTDVTKLDNDLNEFPNSGGGLLQALQIQTDTSTLESAIQKTTTDVNNNGPVDDTDGNAILKQINIIFPMISSGLAAIVSKKPSFSSLGLTGVVKSDLTSLESQTDSLSNALIAQAPVDLKPTASLLKSKVDAAFATAIAAYS